MESDQSSLEGLVETGPGSDTPCFEHLLDRWAADHPDGPSRAARAGLLSAVFGYMEADERLPEALLTLPPLGQLEVQHELILCRKVALEHVASDCPGLRQRMNRFHRAIDGLLLELSTQIYSQEHSGLESARFSEGQLRRLLEKGPIGLCTWTPDGRVLEANDEFLRVIGYSREELVDGQVRWIDLTPAEFHHVDREAMDEIRHTGASRVHEKEYVRKDGERVWILIGSAELLPDGSAAVSFVIDRTRQREQERFRQLLLGIVGHDLRNPLALIRSSVGMIRRSGDDPARRQVNLERIDGAALRMQRMIDDLLDFTRASVGGGIPISPAPMDLRDVLEQLTHDTPMVHPGQSVELVIEGDLHGCWDAHRLIQALGNLLSNALKHATPGTAVRVHSRAEADHVTVEIRNEGQPIPPELLAVIFEPFRRGSRTSRTGLGLGLFIAQSIARAHGGRVELTSSEPEGTTATLVLPRNRDDSSANARIDRTSDTH